MRLGVPIGAHLRDESQVVLQVVDKEKIQRDRQLKVRAIVLYRSQTGAFSLLAGPREGAASVYA